MALYIHKGRNFAAAAVLPAVLLLCLGRRSEGFVYPKSHVRTQHTHVNSLTDGVRGGIKSFLVGQPPPSRMTMSVPIDPATTPEPESAPVGLDAIWSRVFENTPIDPPKLPSFLSDPGPVLDKLSSEVNDWGQMFRTGLSRSWEDVGGSFRETAQESVSLLLKASAESLDYFTAELGVSWESQEASRQAILDETELFARSLAGLGPYIEANAGASWEQSAPLRDEATMKAAEVVPFVERAASYFASNAAASWEQAGAAWRDEIVETTASSLQDFGPYFIANLGYSWEDSAPFRSVIAGLLLGTLFFVQSRQQGAAEISKPTKAGQFNPFLSKSVKNVQSFADITKGSNVVAQLQQRLAASGGMATKGKKMGRKILPAVKGGQKNPIEIKGLSLLTAKKGTKTTAAKRKPTIAAARKSTPKKQMGGFRW